MMKNDNLRDFKCEFCKATFNIKYNYERHLKTNKKCLERRPKIEFKCIWCDELCFHAPRQCDMEENNFDDRLYL